MPLTISAPVHSPSTDENDYAVLTDPQGNKIPLVALVHPSTVDGSNELGTGTVVAGNVSQVTNRQGKPTVTIGGKTVPVMAVLDLTANAAAFKKAGGKFQSTVQTGTGSAQNIAHGLGVVPSLVLVSIYDTNGVALPIAVSEGAHDATNVVVTATASVKYKVIALA